jgi:Ca2+-binding EF-hand superfamily protein
MFKKYEKKGLTKDDFPQFWESIYEEKISKEMANIYWSAIDIDNSNSISFEEFIIFESLRLKELTCLDDYVDCKLKIKNSNIFGI